MQLDATGVFLMSARNQHPPTTPTSTPASPVVESLLERFINPLFVGDRSGARAIIAEAFEEGLSSEEIIMQLIWPTMEKVQGLYRADRINTGVHHMASRLLRMLGDQLALRLSRAERNGRTMLVICSPGEPEELGAQITTDLAEAHGWGCCVLPPAAACPMMKSSAGSASCNPRY